MRTLAVHTGGIGDFVLCLPALAHLALDGPLELVGRQERLDLAVAGGIAQAAHHLDTVDFASAWTESSPRLRAFLAPFDRAVVWMKDDGTLLRALRSCGVGEVRCHPGLPPEDWPGHAMDYYAHCVGLPEARPIQLAIEAAADAPEVVLHPGSGIPKKNWPRRNFEAVADASRRQGNRISWCLGPAEEGFQAPTGDLVLRCPSLVALAEYLAGAALCIGNDSGIAHLSTALGRPTVTIFGPTDPHRWAPRGDAARALSGNPWPTVAQVIETAFECRRNHSTWDGES
jgi:heptosyltransferase III